MIRAAGLVKHFGSVRAVEGVSFEVERGEIVGFLGPNRAGKSTTMRMLVGCLHPDAGEVAIAGHPLHAEGREARRRLGYLPETTPLYREMRVDRYLTFVASLRGLSGAARRDACERVIEATDLEGYTTRRIRTLSKGYRQRVGLAQALVGDPDVLVLDEPTSGLDPAEIVRVRERIVALAATRTVLLSTHVLSEVEDVCQRALIIAAGRLVADGSLAELARAQGQTLAVSLTAPAAGALELCGELDGVAAVRELSPGAPGELRLELTVTDRAAVAAKVSALASRRSWTLTELSHELPSLERTFLSAVGSLAELERASEEPPA